VAIRADEIDLAADRELVERWQGGDHEAFNDLYRRHFDRLTSFCQRRVGSHDAAEEIAQEAFVKALQALPRFDGERRFYPWMTVIAGRLCVDHHRRLGRVRPAAEVDTGAVDGDHGTRLAFLADVDNLDRALRRLGPRHLQVLQLRERQGMTYQQIAEHLEVPQSTVEALLFRARKALRREFMAVSGEGKLATLPVVGVALRRLLSARDRIAEVLPTLSQLAGTVAAGAMAVAITAAPFGDRVEPADGRLAVASAPHVISTSEPAVRSHDIASPPMTVEPPAPTPQPGVRALGIGRVSAEYGEAAAAEMPVRAETRSMIVGIDPAEVVSWVTAEIERLGEELP
jgi:RNA polymerase sigma-70 factor (ECF subfamily)